MKASTKLNIVWSLSKIIKIIHIRWITRRYLVLLYKAIDEDIKEFRND